MDDTDEADPPRRDYIIALITCVKCRASAARRHERLYKPPQMCLACEEEERSRYIYLCLRCRNFCSVPLVNGAVAQECIFCPRCRGDTPEQLEGRV